MMLRSSLEACFDVCCGSEANREVKSCLDAKAGATTCLTFRDSSSLMARAVNMEPNWATVFSRVVIRLFKARLSASSLSTFSAVLFLL